MSEFLKDIDPLRYFRPPLADVAGTVALGIALISATHRGFPPAVRREAKVLRAAILKLQQDWAVQEKEARTPRGNLREADLRTDRAWGALSGILQALASLPDALPAAQRARRLQERLFPTGLRFLALPFNQQWAEGEQKLRVIEHEELDRELAQLAGAVVLEEVRAAHEAYGRLLGITDAEDEVKLPVNLLESLRQVRDAMAGYTLQVIAAGQSAAAFEDPARAALRPYDALREAQARRAAARARANGVTDSGTEEPEEDGTEASDEALDASGNPVAGPTDEVTPSTPVPDVDDVVTV